MGLLNNELSLWEIAFRIENRDPDKIWQRIPLPVRDNFRLMLDAIINGHLPCLMLSLEKWTTESNAPPEDFIRYHLDDVYQCIAGVRYNRKLLRHAVIERWAMQQWCERQGIPLPEFWFPPGWKTRYEWDEPEAYESPAAGVSPETSEVPISQASPELPTPPLPNRFWSRRYQFPLPQPTAKPRDAAS
jgi:hypothetical protein